MYFLYSIRVQTRCFAGCTLLRIMLEKKKTFFLPTDPTQKFRVDKGQTKYNVFFNLGLRPKQISCVKGNGFKNFKKGRLCFF